MAKVHEWKMVPDGSALRVKVDDGIGTVKGFYAESDGDGRKLTKVELRKGVEFPLQKPERYSVGLVFVFAKASTFTVRASVTKPGGTLHGAAFNEQVTATAGQVVVLAVVATTLQS